ncbi:MAG: hypothetical protein GWO24_24435, partial [Akkermansiaceae bacterium]|nr:hypothetical protein [Akkermansiaceae bacterium]
VNGRTLHSQPIDLHVSPLPGNSWKTHELLGRDLRFASNIFLPRRVPYEGETIPA